MRPDRPLPPPPTTIGEKLSKAVDSVKEFSVSPFRMLACRLPPLLRGKGGTELIVATGTAVPAVSSWVNAKTCVLKGLLKYIPDLVENLVINKFIASFFSLVQEDQLMATYGTRLAWSSIYHGQTLAALLGLRWAYRNSLFGNISATWRQGWYNKAMTVFSVCAMGGLALQVIFSECLFRGSIPSIFNYWSWAINHASTMGALLEGYLTPIARFFGFVKSPPEALKDIVLPFSASCFTKMACDPSDAPEVLSATAARTSWMHETFHKHGMTFTTKESEAKTRSFLLVLRYYGGRATEMTQEGTRSLGTLFGRDHKGAPADITPDNVFKAMSVATAGTEAGKLNTVMGAMGPDEAREYVRAAHDQEIGTLLTRIIADAQLDDKSPEADAARANIIPGPEVQPVIPLADMMQPGTAADGLSPLDVKNSAQMMEVVEALIKDADRLRNPGESTGLRVSDSRLKKLYALVENYQGNRYAPSRNAARDRIEYLNNLGKLYENAADEAQSVVRTTRSGLALNQASYLNQHTRQLDKIATEAPTEFQQAVSRMRPGTINIHTGAEMIAVAQTAVTILRDLVVWGAETVLPLGIGAGVKYSAQAGQLAATVFAVAQNVPGFTSAFGAAGKAAASASKMATGLVPSSVKTSVGDVVDKFSFSLDTTDKAIIGLGIMSYISDVSSSWIYDKYDVNKIRVYTALHNPAAQGFTGVARHASYARGLEAASTLYAATTAAANVGFDNYLTLLLAQNDASIPPEIRAAMEGLNHGITAHTTLSSTSLIERGGSDLLDPFEPPSALHTFGATLAVVGVKQLGEAVGLGSS